MEMMERKLHFKQSQVESVDGEVERVSILTEKDLKKRCIKVYDFMARKEE